MNFNGHPKSTGKVQTVHLSSMADTGLKTKVSNRPLQHFTDLNQSSKIYLIKGVMGTKKLSGVSALFTLSNLHYF